MRLGEFVSEKIVKKKPHTGHRQRLRKRFEKTGLDGFNDYEVLELILTFILPYKDTKPVAKELFERYKSLKGIFDAEITDLQAVKGIGERTAVYFRLLQETFGYLYDEQARNREIQFTKTKHIFGYFKATIGNSKNEIMRAVYLNSQNEMIKAENVSEGTVSETVVLPRKIVETALKHNAVSVIVAHNHPDGIAEPSDNDDKMTEQIRNALQTVNINLQDHLVITESDYFSYRQKGYLG